MSHTYVFLTSCNWCTWKAYDHSFLLFISSSSIRSSIIMDSVINRFVGSPKFCESSVTLALKLSLLWWVQLCSHRRLCVLTNQESVRLLFHCRFVMFVLCTLFYGNLCNLVGIRYLCNLGLHSTLHMQSLRPQCDFEKGLLFCICFVLSSCWLFQLLWLEFLFLFADFCMRIFQFGLWCCIYKHETFVFPVFTEPFTLLTVFGQCTFSLFNQILE